MSTKELSANQRQPFSRSGGRRTLSGELPLGRAMRRGDGDSSRGIFVELIAQRADGNAKDVCSMGAIAEALFERLQDQVPFDVGDGATDERAHR
jgi:hypothetical protein